ncbi:hypothetical protein [Plantactinospora sp. KBS50]|uniref:hypothetical protein n=1 Tax=Plantactinospora sp. KBS50 TaxID=2024580 RepID=UPI0012FD3872|nr:hypothetical protein [Plantactinospora sp. KBS50]
MQISPQLVDKLRRSTDETRHRIVERACLLAVQRADVAAPKLTEALDAIRRRKLSPPDLRSEIDALTQELDEIAWDIQDRIEAGDATEAEYRRAFVKARAAAAVGFALEGSLAASFDSLYEAYYAVDNRDDYMRVVAD